jgi:hypothetical protein
MLLDDAEDVERFGPLKVILRSIPAAFANRRVRSQSPAQNSLTDRHFQGAVVVGNKVENLLFRVVALEERFDSCPNDIAEQRRRDDLIGYVATSRLSPMLKFLQQVEASRDSTPVVV